MNRTVKQNPISFLFISLAQCNSGATSKINVARAKNRRSDSADYSSNRYPKRALEHNAIWKKGRRASYPCWLKWTRATAISRMLTIPSLLTSALGFQFGELGLVLNSITRRAMSRMFTVPSMFTSPGIPEPL